MGKTIFITGATAGFGRATAEIFAKNGNRVIITGRRNDRLNELKDELEKEFNADVLPLHFDVRNRDAVQATVATLPHEWCNIDVLVNNAGLASGRDPVQSGDFEDWDKMIDTNVKGLRHAHATALLRAGVHPKVVQERLGHSSISVTIDIYSSVLPGMQREAVERLASMMGMRAT